MCETCGAPGGRYLGVRPEVVLEVLSNSDKKFTFDEIMSYTILCADESEDDEIINDMETLTPGGAICKGNVGQLAYYGTIKIAWAGRGTGKLIIKGCHPIRNPN